MSKEIFDGGSNESSQYRQLSLENAWKGPGGYDNDASFAEKALGGFVDSAREAWSKPAETAVSVGSGLAIGAAIQTGLNNAEMMGGKVGTVARAGKTLLLGGTALVTAHRLLSADDSAYESGKLAFEMGLFLGAAKTGSLADRVPGVSNYLGPRATTHIPSGLDYRVLGNTVRVKPDLDSGYPMQVRLTNGKGFRIDTRWDREAKLVDMPRTTRDGVLEYDQHTTTLINNNGRFTKNLLDRSVSTERGGRTLATGDGKTFHIHRDTGPLGHEKVTFTPEGNVGVLQGSYQSGRAWTLAADGSMSMRSLPAGKYRIDLKPDGQGTYTYTHGTSRGIMGMAGPRSRHAPLTRDQSAVSASAQSGSPDALPFPIPDFTRPHAKFTDDLTAALEILNKH